MNEPSKLKGPLSVSRITKRNPNAEQYAAKDIKKKGKAKLTNR
jgi:hypothetical protein